MIFGAMFACRVLRAGERAQMASGEAKPMIIRPSRRHSSMKVKWLAPGI